MYEKLFRFATMTQLWLYMRCISVIFFLIFAVNELNAQSPWQLEDTIRKKYEWIYGFDNRRTHIQSQGTLIYGVFTGVGYRDKVRLKIGLNGTPFEVGNLFDVDDNLKRNRLVFLTVGNEFDFYQKDKFRLTAYSQVGYGFNFFRITNQDNQVITEEQRNIIPLELGVHGNYYLFPWLSVKLGGGWRWVFPEVSSELSGYYLKIALGFSTNKFLFSYRKWKNGSKLDD